MLAASRVASIPEHDLSAEEVEELREHFEKVDLDNDGHVDIDEVVEALSQAGDKLPGYKARLAIQEVDMDHDGKISLDEFLALVSNVRRSKDAGFKKVVKQANKVTQFAGSEASAEGTTHSVADDEKVGFIDWINYSLGHDEDLLSSQTVPVSDQGHGLYDACHDGVLLAKLINIAVPETVDERALNKKKLNVYTIHENQTLVINSAKAIGVNVINIGAQDLIDGVPHLCLGLIWQIIRIGLLAKVNLKFCPGLARLLEEGETIEQLMALPAEQILLRWFNYHLAQAGHPRRVNNFTGDIKDSENYTVLLKQIAPRHLGITDSPLREKDELKRAELMLQNADKLDCRRFVKPTDVVNGHPKLNLAFVANLFNTHPGLEPIEDVQIPEEVIEETREEKTFRNWMNSLGVQPYVSHLYQDLHDGLVLIQLFDKVFPSTVEWNRVNQAPFKAMGATMRKIENCSYAMDLGRKHKFSLVGIDGKDVYDGNKTLTLAVVWQLMRAYTLEVLKRLSGNDKPISDNDVISWVNTKLKDAGKTTSISSFKDSSISDSMPVLDLVDAIKPNSVDYSLVVRGANSEKDKMSNAKYAVSMARKIGANVYALPEDLVEVNQKMVMTVFACLMSCSYSAK
eukprot:comp23227_c0_seq1/m.37881 comp23227_c0_seq1/g.37881  ORF comp23227_c0_seq1/g.37881 comp23227_c0_seq1/m.37881 type:complete len:627 (-) comp23227_c0_seq1:284-2164(-)